MEQDPLVLARDGLLARAVGVWSIEKLYHIRRYLDLFTKSMRNKFPHRIYVDLFAGPGRCVIDNGSSEELDGSPLIALKLKTPFTEHHLVELDRRAAEALRARVEREAPGRTVVYYEQDANAAALAIADRIPLRSLSVTVIDPTGLHLDFPTLRRLTEGRKMDLIYLFPEGMCVKRNLTKFMKQKQSPLDRILGTDRWRDRVQLPEGPDPLRRWEAAVRPLVELLQEQIHGLGYEDVHGGSSVVEIRNKKNVPLYYLVFASKHPLGHKFWEKIGERHADGQGHLKLEA
jgi:three-Cys-motif partner protein